MFGDPVGPPHHSIVLFTGKEALDSSMGTEQFLRDVAGSRVAMIYRLPGLDIRPDLEYTLKLELRGHEPSGQERG